MTRRLVSYVLAAGLALVVIMVALGQFDAIFGAQDASTTASSRAQLRLHPALVRMRARMRALELAYRARGDSLATLAAAQDSADSARAVAGGQPPPPPSLWRAAFDECRGEVRACQARVLSAEQEVLDLHARLTAQVAVRDRRCGLFAGLGAAAGFGGTAAGGAVILGCRVFPR